jgi:serine O-acetyltransferase
MGTIALSCSFFFLYTGEFLVMRGRGYFRHDVRRTYERMEGRNVSRILACVRSPGLHAVAVYRFGNWLLEQNFLINALLLPFYLLLNYQVKAVWGICIRRRAIIGEGLFIGHWGGIFISGMAVIGRNCEIFQDVSIGVSRYGNQYGYPIIGDNVHIGPGVKIHGRVNIGSNVHIAPNATIDRNIPDNVYVEPPPLQVVRISPHSAKAPTKKAV